MIAVIADDITGAAEMGGIAHRLGLRVKLTVKPEPSPDCDVLVIATDTRSMSVDKAVEESRQVASALSEIPGIDAIFKRPTPPFAAMSRPNWRLCCQRLNMSGRSTSRPIRRKDALSVTVSTTSATLRSMRPISLSIRSFRRFRRSSPSVCPTARLKVSLMPTP